MKINSLEPLPAEFVAKIDESCESARAHMAARENIRVWSLTATCAHEIDAERTLAPIDIECMLCDPESMIGAIRAVLVGAATLIFNSGVHFTHFVVCIEPAVRPEDIPDEEVRSFIEENTWAMAK